MQERLPGMPYYEPTDRGAEAEIGKRLEAIRDARKAGSGQAPGAARSNDGPRIGAKKWPG